MSPGEFFLLILTAVCTILNAFLLADTMRMVTRLSKLMIEVLNAIQKERGA